MNWLPEITKINTMIVIMITLFMWKGQKIYRSLKQFFKIPLYFFKILKKKIQRHTEKTTAFDLCQNGTLDQFKAYMELHKLSPNVKQTHSSVPLLTIAIHHKRPKNLKDSNQITQNQHDRLQFLKYLLDKGADVEAKDNGDRTAFFTAIYWNFIDSARVLYNNDPHPNVDCVAKWFNPLSSALFKKFHEATIFLVVVCKADEIKALGLIDKLKVPDHLDEAKKSLNIIRFLYAKNSALIMKNQQKSLLTEEQKVLTLLNDNEIAEIFSMING